MADVALRTDPVPTAPAVFAGVTVSLAPAMTRWSLRARDPAVLEGLIGQAVPRRIGASEGGLICLGPDEWLLRADAGTQPPNGSGLKLSLVEISERAVALVLDGPRAAQVLMAGCPRDLGRFAVGQAARTIFEGVEIVVVRTAPDRFEVDVWRSFAPWLYLALTKAAAHLD